MMPISVTITKRLVGLFGLCLLIGTLSTGSVNAQSSVSGLPVPPNDAASARLKVPPGFAVRLYAKGLHQPRLMTVGPDGLLYVAEFGSGSILRLTDTNNTGIADKIETVASNLDLVHSLEWHNGWLYAATGGEIVRLKSSVGTSKLDVVERLVDVPAAVHHVTRTAHFGPDGKLYVTVGSSSNNNPETDPRRAAMLRFNDDGTIPSDNPYATDSNPLRHPIWAEGLRNSVDFVFLPDGRLWADHNGSDDLGNDTPPEEVVIQVEKGNHYGWPYCYTPVLGVVPAGTVDAHDTRVPFSSALTGCDKAAPALFTDLAHSAPIGMVYYGATGDTAFPTLYQGNIFIAYHGSWNSSQPRDCRVQMITVKDGQPTASSAFLTGFRSSDQDQCGSAWGRPAGLAVGAKGELFVSDNQNGNIYRIVYSGQS